MKALLLMLVFVSAQSFAGDAPPAQDPKMAEMMKAYEAAAKPGPEHKMLADMAGKYKTTNKFWHAPNTKPEEATGTSTMKMIMGGRWLQQEFKGKVMGKPFEGMGMVGSIVVKNITTMAMTNGTEANSRSSIRGSGWYSSTTTTDTAATPAITKSVTTYAESQPSRFPGLSANSSVDTMAAIVNEPT